MFKISQSREIFTFFICIKCAAFFILKLGVQFKSVIQFARRKMVDWKQILSLRKQNHSHQMHTSYLFSFSKLKTAFN